MLHLTKYMCLQCLILLDLIYLSSEAQGKAFFTNFISPSFSFSNIVSFYKSKQLQCGHLHADILICKKLHLQKQNTRKCEREKSCHPESCS